MSFVSVLQRKLLMKFSCFTDNEIYVTVENSMTNILRQNIIVSRFNKFNVFPCWSLMWFISTIAE